MKSIPRDHVLHGISFGGQLKDSRQTFRGKKCKEQRIYLIYHIAWPRIIVPIVITLRILLPRRSVEPGVARHSCCLHT